MNNVLALQMLSADTGEGAGAVEDGSVDTGTEALSNVSALTCGGGDGRSHLSLTICN